MPRTQIGSERIHYDHLLRKRQWGNVGTYRFHAGEGIQQAAVEGRILVTKKEK
jgi:hypothetical protein